jgi:hypothetical protein
MPPPPARKSAQISPPAEATHFSLFRAAAGENIRKAKRVTGEPLDDGTVPDSWPVAEFSMQRILQSFGEGKYTVVWFGSDGTRCAPTDMFNIATPSKKAAKGARLGSRKLPRPDDAFDDEPEPPRRSRSSGGASSDGFGLLEIMAMMDRTTQAAEARAEKSSQAQMQMFMAMQQSQTAMLTAIIGRPAPAGAPDDLVRREIAVGIREAEQRIRAEMGEQEDESDDDAPPADMQEAIERMGIGLVEHITGQAPEFAQKMIGIFGSLAERAGVQPSPETQARIAAAVAAGPRAHANGR